MDKSTRRIIWKTVLAFVACAAYAPVAFAQLSHASPGAVGMDSARLAGIDQLVAEHLANGRMPGCVVTIGRHGKIAFQRAYGHRQLEPETELMAEDTLFDLASLTKPIATATSIMVLIDRGKLRLRDRVAMHIPEFGQHGKDEITVQQLLTHVAGLIADNSLNDYEHGVAEAWERIWAVELVAEPDEKFIYSDVGFIVLGELVKRITGQNVDEFARENVFVPLGMSETGYLPAASLRPRAATTEQREDRWMRGEVHDPRAYALGGIAGHAGLFSTARDLSVYAQMMLNGGRYAGRRILSQRAVDVMTSPYQTPRGIRGLGWDINSPYSSNRGDLFTDRAFGHGGFTGTAIWMDPGLGMFVIFLANRVHPDGKGHVNYLAARIGSVAAGAVRASQAATVEATTIRSGDDASHSSAVTEVLCGIDVLKKENFAPLNGRRVGLITNHTGIDRDGHSTVRLLHDAPQVELVALFSPEHGIAGKLDIADITDTRDETTGLPIFSLYGETRQPTAESLQGIDTLVFDIQDIGTRFYTYVSTMGLAMQAAAEQGLRFVVLDRPNPLGGVVVSGPVLDAGRESFVGFHTLPVRHGMTIGELAMLFNDEMQLELDLQVVRLRGWQRDMLWDETGLLWVNPSPNMRNLTEAILYPGIGLLETTNVSVGRGTDTPFEVLGAPWIDGRQLARRMNERGLPGARFVPIRFTPNASKFNGEMCEGVNVIVTNRADYQPVRAGLEIACQLRQLYPDKWQRDGYNRLLADQAVFDAVDSGKPAEEICNLYDEELNKFRRRREKFLLYYSN